MSSEPKPLGKSVVSWFFRMGKPILFWFWTLILPGFALGLGVAWAEKKFHWRKGLGGDLLLAFMLVMFPVVLYLLYRMIRAEIEEDNWDT